MKLKIYTTFLSIFIFSLQLQAQLFIDNSYTVEEMATDFFANTCVTPSNITTTGVAESIAFFDAGGTNLGVNAGIFISTGNVFDAIGPNTGGATGQSMGIDGDDDLSNLIGSASFDGVTIEMDVIATESNLEFSYVFASEEYPEFVGSAFNDAFAFFISGPGISGWQNIAMIPNSNDAVAINNVNANMNSTFYVDNTGGQDIEFDGYTTEMIASVQVTPNETYQIKIVVSDFSDSVFDSGIFLGIESLCGSEDLVPTNVSNVIVNDNTVTFENNTKYVASNFWDFGDGTTSNEKIPTPHTYAADGMYEVTLITSTFCCSDTTTMMVQIGDVNSIDDLEKLPYSIAPNPTQDFTILNFENGEQFFVQVFDATGKLIFSKNGNGQSTLDFSNLPKGFYSLNIQASEKIYTERIIKN